MDRFIKPLDIFIDEKIDVLCLNEIKYVFRTLLTILGFSWRFVKKWDSGVDIAYALEKRANCHIFIQALNHKPYNNAQILVKQHNNQLFLIFDVDQQASKLVDNSDGTLFINNDIIYSSLYMLNGDVENHLPKNRFGMHNLEKSYLKKFQLMHQTLVNKYANLIGEAFKERENIPIWPNGKNYAVALSHDVDYPEMIKWIEAIRYISGKGLNKRIIYNILSGRESFWQFKSWMELENKFGLKSIFYFCGRQGSLLKYLFGLPDPFYNINEEKYKDIMRLILDSGFEVGMHASYNAYISKEKFQEEKALFENAIGCNIYGNRHHYLHLDPTKPYKTLKIHYDVGLLFDCSICFNDYAGFRRGICSPYYIYDPDAGTEIKTLEFPTSLMDGQLYLFF